MISFRYIFVNSLLVGAVTLGGYSMAQKHGHMETGSTVSAIEVHGHRGSRGTHPENTLPAFQEAVESGAEVLELDLQLTKDDVPVISHDPEIGALCNDEKGQPVTTRIPIRTLTFAEIQKFDCGSRPNPKFPEQKAVPSKFTSLEQFLVWAKKHALKLAYNIETKMTAPREELIAPPKLFAKTVEQLLRKHGAIDKTILQSFDFRTLREAKTLNPKLRLSCLFENTPNFCDATANERAAFASPDWQSVTPEEVKRCHQLGIKVAPWTANSEDSWNKMVQCNVDAIITDYPRKLVDYLKAHPAKKSEKM